MTKKLWNPAQKKRVAFLSEKVIDVVPANKPPMAKLDIDDIDEQVVMIFRFFQRVPLLEVLRGLYRVLPF